MEAGQEFLRHYKLHGDEFLLSNVTEASLKLRIGRKRLLNDEEMKGEVEKLAKGLAGN